MSESELVSNGEGFLSAVEYPLLPKSHPLASFTASLTLQAEAVHASSEHQPYQLTLDRESPNDLAGKLHSAVQDSGILLETLEGLLDPQQRLARLFEIKIDDDDSFGPIGSFYLRFQTAHISGENELFTYKFYRTDAEHLRDQSLWKNVQQAVNEMKAPVAFDPQLIKTDSPFVDSDRMGTHHVSDSDRLLVLQDTINALPLEDEILIVKLVGVLNTVFIGRQLSNTPAVTSHLLDRLVMGQTSELIEAANLLSISETEKNPAPPSLRARAAKIIGLRQRPGYASESQKDTLRIASTLFNNAMRADAHLEEAADIVAIENIRAKRADSDEKSSSLAAFIQVSDSIDRYFAVNFDGQNKEAALCMLAVDRWRADVYEALLEKRCIVLESVAQDALRNQLRRIGGMPLHAILLQAEAGQEDRNREIQTNAVKDKIKEIEGQFVPTSDAIRAVDNGLRRATDLEQRLLNIGIQISRKTAQTIVKIASDFSQIQDRSDRQTYIGNFLACTDDTVSLLATLQSLTRVSSDRPIIITVKNLLAELADADSTDTLVDKDVSDLARAIHNHKEDSATFSEVGQEARNSLETLGTSDLQVFPPSVGQGTPREVLDDFTSILKREDDDTELEELRHSYSDLEWGRLHEIVLLRDQLISEGKNAKLLITAPTKWSRYPFLLLWYSDNGDKVILESLEYESATYVIINEEDGIWQLIAQGTRVDAKKFPTVHPRFHSTSLKEHRAKIHTLVTRS